MRLIFVVIIILLLILLYIHCTEQIKENLITALTDSKKINTLKDLRDFLEEAYAVCYTNPNSISNSVKNTVCYKISVLGTYIPPILGSIATQDMESLFALYSSPKNSIGSTEPPAPGILTSTQDYIMLLQLYIASKNLKMFSSGAFPIWKQDIDNGKALDDSDANPESETPSTPSGATITTDLCENQTKESSAIIGYAIELYDIIDKCLQHFHNQLENTKSVTYGDTPDTNTYSEAMTSFYSEYISDSCVQGKTNICKGRPAPSDFYSAYANMTYTDFPNPGTFSLKSYMAENTKKFRVLLIGAGGGGGGAASGKWNNNGHDQQGGGGGGGGGGGITSSAEYPYSNNYQITVGSSGRGGYRVNCGSKRSLGTRGSTGVTGNASTFYDTSNKETLLSADGGIGGSGGFPATGNKGGSGFTDIGIQGGGGAGGTGLTNNGNSGEGGEAKMANGAEPGFSVPWSTRSEAAVNSLNGGTGGNAPTVGRNNGHNTPGGAGSNGQNGFVRVYWIP